MGRIAARRFGMDVATHITHAPLRVFAMGERALRDGPANASDIAAMAKLVREGMAAGAVGFSTGRFVEHRSTGGKGVPGTYASEEEVLALAGAMDGRGTFQIILRGGIGSLLMPGITREERLLEHSLLEISLYWFTNTGGSSARLYWELGDGFIPGQVDLPIGVSLFPREILRPSRRWVDRYWNKVDRGGHFAAWEEPDLFVEEMRKCFGMAEFR